MLLFKLTASLVLTVVALIGVIFQLLNSPLLIIPIICVPLAFHIAGYVSRSSPIDVKIKDHLEKVQRRRSKGYRCRRVFGGLIALGLGGFVSHALVPEGALLRKPVPALGGAMLLFMGIFAIFRKREYDAPITSEEIQRALLFQTLDEKDPAKREEAIRLAAEASGHSQAEMDKFAARASDMAREITRKVVKDVFDATNLSEDERKDCEANSERMRGNFRSSDN